jgi:uncharacterized protein
MIEKSLLTEVVIEQNNLFRKDKNYLDRVIAENFVKTKKIMVIAGIRRCGKSTLLKQLSKQYDKFYYLNFEDERLLNFESSDFNHLLEIFMEIYGKCKTIFFDEIQNVFGWEKFVNRLFTEGYKVYVTGSNANLLSRELATALTGRHLKTELYPFSFKEYLAYNNVGSYNLALTSDRAKIKRQFSNYLKYGGFPEIVDSKDRNELRQLYQDILIKDLLVRFKIREDKSFRELALYLMSNIGAQISFNNIKKILGLNSVSSVKNYVGYLEESYLLFSLFKYDYSLKKQIINDRKVYGIDSGMIQEVAFSFSKNSGRYLENLVFLELKRRLNEVFYYRNKFECDFIIRKGTKIVQAIQVTDSLNINNKDREIRGLAAALEEHGLSEGLIITSDKEGEESINGKKIKIIPVWKWLLLS